VVAEEVRDPKVAALLEEAEQDPLAFYDSRPTTGLVWKADSR
jgi:hypothetical protein